MQRAVRVALLVVGLGAAPPMPSFALASTIEQRPLLDDGAQSCGGRTAADVANDLSHDRNPPSETCGINGDDPQTKTLLRNCTGQLEGAHRVEAADKAVACRTLIRSGALNVSQLSIVYVSLSRADTSLHDQKHALADLDSAVAWNPASALAWARSCSFNNRRDTTRAEAECAEAIRLDPKQADAWTFRGDIYLAQGRYDLAIGDYDHAILLSPRWMWPWVNRGAALLRSGKLDEAERDFEQAIKLAPDLSEGYAELGSVQILRKQYALAASEFEKGLAVAPSSARCLYGRGLVKLLTGDASGSTDLNEALRIEPDTAAAFARDGIHPAQAASTGSGEK